MCIIQQEQKTSHLHHTYLHVSPGETKHDKQVDCLNRIKEKSAPQLETMINYRLHSTDALKSEEKPEEKQFTMMQKQHDQKDAGPNWRMSSRKYRAGVKLQASLMSFIVLIKPLPLSLLSSTRTISFSRCAGVWLTTLWTERRITDRASFTKMKTTEIWGRSSGYVSCLHL